MVPRSDSAVALSSSTERESALQTAPPSLTHPTTRPYPPLQASPLPMAPTEKPTPAVGVTTSGSTTGYTTVP